MPTVGLRAAEYAGWWTGKPRMSTTINATLNRSSPWLVTSRYYQDNPATGYANGSYGGLSSPTNALIDTTGLTNTANYTTAMTIRFGTSYLASAPSNTNGANWYDRFISAGTTYFPVMGVAKGSGSNYSLSIGTPSGGGGSAGISNFDSSLRNTWLTFIVAVSTSASSFANWTGIGTGASYIRVAVMNTQTGQLTQSVIDIVSGGTAITKDFSQNWYLDSTGSSSYSYAPFWYVGNGDWNLYGLTDWDCASIWHGWNVIDPLPNYPLFAGSAVSASVQGLTSTALIQFTGAGSRTSGDDGFTFTVGGNGSRIPSNSVYYADTNQGTSTNSPALVSF